jgi:glucosyl-dolichyl phosphate glucuronosyltransferase
MNEPSNVEPTLAVVVPSCDMQRYGQLRRVIESLLQQSYKASEIIVVANGSKELGDRLEADFGHHENIRVIVIAEFLRAGQARNMGIKATSADIVAFTDDDSVPHNRWIEKLVETYRLKDAIAVGGKVLPVWLAKEPSFLPEGLYWLVGVTHEKIFGEAIAEVRNTFGPNMSVRRDVLESVGYFDEQLGFKGSSSSLSLLGGEEQDLGLRIKHKFGKGMIYNPEAIVYHDVPPGKTKVSTLIRRAYYFGVAKRLILGRDRFENNMDTEKSYMVRILTDFMPGHLRDMFRGPAHSAAFQKLAFLLLVVLMIGAGFTLGNFHAH